MNSAVGVVGLLAEDVGSNGSELVSTDAKHAITRLPSERQCAVEIIVLPMFVDETRGHTLDLVHVPREGKGTAEADQKMNVIRCATNR